MKLAPKDPDALLARGTIRYDLKDYGGAVQDARAALAARPADANAAALLKLTEKRVPAEMKPPP